MFYTVNAAHFSQNSGYSYTETVDRGETDEFFTAEEWNSCGWFTEAENSWVIITVSFYDDGADPMFDDPIKTSGCTI